MKQNMGLIWLLSMLKNHNISGPDCGGLRNGINLNQPKIHIVKYPGTVTEIKNSVEPLGAALNQIGQLSPGHLQNQAYPGIQKKEQNS